MKKFIIKSFDKIIVVLLGFLGIFNSCERPCEYGVPHGQYEFKGIVTNKETSDPIQNIQVVTYRDTVYTDNEGKFTFNVISPPFSLKVEDIDGEENGGDFAMQTIDVKFTKADQVEKGDGKWYEGKFVKTQNIKLEKKGTVHPEYGMPATTFKP